MLSDSLGNPVTLDDPASLALYEDFVSGFIRCEARVANVLQLAERDLSPIVQASCAALHLFAESPLGPLNAAPFVARARERAAQVSPREQRFVAAIEAWASGDLERATALHAAQAVEFPRDLASVKLGQYHLFNRGDCAGMLRIVLPALGAAADVPQVHGMAAFAWEQCHLLPQAEAAARRALALEPREPWAQHALAHVMLTEGRLHEGRAFMHQASSGWIGLNSFMQTHNWWHLALFALELGDPDEVLRLYDREVWGVVKEYSQDQIGAVSLLARLELAGVDVGDRWQDLADHLVERVHDHVLPFLDLQYLYGLARAGRPEAHTLLGSVEAFCRGERAASAPDGNPRPVDPVWPAIALPAARGLLAHAQGRWDEAAALLGEALPRMLQIGGSHAQRDLFSQIHVDAMMRAGHWGAAQQLLQERLRTQPESRRLARQAREACHHLGLDAAFPCN